MTVQELIDKLKEYDSEMPVCMSGYEGGVTEKWFIEKHSIQKNVNQEWWYGEHEIEGRGASEAVVFLRER